MFLFLSLFPFPGSVFGNGKTSDYLLLGNTVYTVSLYWLELKRYGATVTINSLHRRFNSVQCLKKCLESKKWLLSDSLRNFEVHFVF